jgi:Domain of unknown function (DUF4396)
MLHVISVWFLLLSGISFLIIALDLWKRPQMMRIMNLVWPITALYFGPVALWTYFSFGREKPMARGSGGMMSSPEKPFWKKVWVGGTHCGAGCTLGDIAAEWGIFLTGFSLFGSGLAASYFFDFAFAYVLGIVFQYAAIAPMRNLKGWPVIKAALKADTVSLIAFEVGLFAFMFWMHHHFHPTLEPTSPEFWFLMQIGMMIGFFTSYPANWWLIRNGWKEAM